MGLRCDVQYYRWHYLSLRFANQLRVSSKVGGILIYLCIFGHQSISQGRLSYIGSSPASTVLSTNCDHSRNIPTMYARRRWLTEKVIDCRKCRDKLLLSRTLSIRLLPRKDQLVMVDERYHPNTGAPQYVAHHSILFLDGLAALLLCAFISRRFE